MNHELQDSRADAVQSIISNVVVYLMEQDFRQPAGDDASNAFDTWHKRARTNLEEYIAGTLENYARQYAAEIERKR